MDRTCCDPYRFRRRRLFGGPDRVRRWILRRFRGRDRSIDDTWLGRCRNVSRRQSLAGRWVAGRGRCCNLPVRVGQGFSQGFGCVCGTGCLDGVGDRRVGARSRQIDLRIGGPRPQPPCDGHRDDGKQDASSRDRHRDAFTELFPRRKRCRRRAGFSGRRFRRGRRDGPAGWRRGRGRNRRRGRVGRRFGRRDVRQPRECSQRQATNPSAALPAPCFRTWDRTQSAR